MAIKNEESQQTKNKPLSQTRRTALKKMLVGTGVAASAAAVPGKWAKPIVDKVLVPAHAQTSCPELPANYRGEIDIVEEDAKLSLWDTLREAVIPSALAGFSPDSIDAELCIGIECDSATGKITFEAALAIVFQQSGGYGFYLTGGGEVDGPSATLTEQNGCTWVEPASIEVISVDLEKASFSFIMDNGHYVSTGEIGPGDGCPDQPEPACE